MAEYYPLLSRAVSGLRDGPPEKRHAIYDRARQALLGQLRSMEQANPDLIDRESKALDDAIAQVETEIGVERALAEPIAESPAPPAPAAATPAAPTSAPPARPARPERPPVSAALPPRPAASGSAALRPPASGPLARPPLAPSGSRPTPTPLRPPPPPRPAPSSATTPGPAPAASAGGMQAGAAPALRASRSGEDAGPALPAAPRLQVQTQPPSQADAGQKATATPEPNKDAEPTADGEIQPTRGEALRPAAPRSPVLQERFSPRFLIVALVAALMVAGIGYTAWRLRDKPEALARARAAMQAARSTDASQPGKIVSRADGGAPPTIAPDKPTNGEVAPPPADQSAASAPADSGQQATTPPPQPSPAPDTSASPAPAPVAAVIPPATTPPSTANATLPVAQRAALLVDAPDDPQKVKTYVGTVVWTTESVSPGQGQPLATSVRAEVEVPDAGLKLSMLIQKNFEAQFPASHTIELRFAPQPGNTLGSIKQINVPQLRKDDAPTGDSLAGLPVTITDNYFLVGLSRGDVVARNLDLLQSRNWIDVPLLFASGKVAKITFEKGPMGERLINNAIQSWQ